MMDDYDLKWNLQNETNISQKMIVLFFHHIFFIIHHIYLYYFILFYYYYVIILFIIILNFLNFVFLFFKLMEYFIANYLIKILATFMSAVDL